MAIPDFQTLMLPVLQQFRDGKERRSSDVRAPLATAFALTPVEIVQRYAGGVHTVFVNRIAWAIAYLRRALILESPRRGIYRITQRGLDVLKELPTRIDSHYLNKFPEFASPKAFDAPPLPKSIGAEASEDGKEGLPANGPVLTPDEQIHLGAARIRENLIVHLLERVKKGTPAAFEKLVLDLLVAMGYGGSHEDAAEVVGKGGDGGIDGVIRQDRLGLESIYVQAKRWEGTVGRPDIQQFAGALHGKHARKGVFITTSVFSREALEYAKTSQISIVLIDGATLASYMIEFGVGVSDVDTIKIKRLDEDYFSEE
jgi:restriction system protein